MASPMSASAPPDPNAEESQSQDPFLQLAAIPSPGFVSTPLIVECYKNGRVVQNIAAAAVCSFLLIWEFLTRGLTYHCLFWIVGVPVALGLAYYVSISPPTTQFLEFYDKLLLIFGTCFYSFAAGSNMLSFDDQFFTMAFILLPTYHFPQYYKMWSVPVLFLLHTAATMQFYERKPMFVMGTICACIFLSAQVYTADNILAIAFTAETKANEGAKTSKAISREYQMMQLKLRDLLERSFDGIVRVEDGIVKWANHKCSQIFPTLTVGSRLHEAFAQDARSDIDKACAGGEVGWLDTMMGPFQCTLVATAGPKSHHGSGSQRKDSRSGRTLIAGLRKKTPDYEPPMMSSAPTPSIKCWHIDVSESLVVARCDSAIKSACGPKVIGTNITDCLDEPSYFIQQLATAVQRAQLTSDNLIFLGNFTFGRIGSTRKTLQGMVFLFRKSVLDESSDTIQLRVCVD